MDKAAREKARKLCGFSPILMPAFCVAVLINLTKQALDALDAADSDNAKTLRILRLAYTTMAFAFNRLHNSARSRDGELCLDLQKVRAEIEAHFKDTGVTL